MSPRRFTALAVILAVALGVAVVVVVYTYVNARAEISSANRASIERGAEIAYIDCRRTIAFEREQRLLYGAIGPILKDRPVARLLLRRAAKPIGENCERQLALLPAERRESAIRDANRAYGSYTFRDYDVRNGP